MTSSLTVAVADFNRAAELCIQHSERTYERFINSRALHVAKNAIAETEKADANRIAYTLAGNVRTRLSVSRKTGKRKASGKYDVMEDSLAARIVNARLAKGGGSRLVWGAELAKMARALIAARLRAVAFIRSGWIYAVRTLARAVGESGSAQGATRMNGQPKGYARPARRAINSEVTAEIANTALLSEQAKTRVAEKGLAAAFNRERGEMLRHLAAKIGPVFKQFSA